jgi:hypothetical protein
MKRGCVSPAVKIQIHRDTGFYSDVMKKNVMKEHKCKAKSARIMCSSIFHQGLIRCGYRNHQEDEI